MKIGTGNYINEEDLCMYLLFVREELRHKTHNDYMIIRDLSPDQGYSKDGGNFVKLLNFLKLHKLSLKETYLFTDIEKRNLFLPSDQTFSHLSETQRLTVKKAIENISTDQFSQKDIELVIPYGTYFLSSVCFLTDFSSKQINILQISIDEYVQEFIDDGLLIAERNALIFERQKDHFFHLVLSAHLHEKYGSTFVLENVVRTDSDFFYIHTLLSLEKLEYIVLNHVDFSRNEATFEIKYRVNLKLNEIFINEMNRKYQKDHPEAVFESYDTTSGTLNFSGKKIELSKSTDSDAARLMSTVTTNILHNWSKDEVYDDWKYSLEEQKELPKQKMYQAAVRIKTSVEKKTQIEDFLIFSTKEVKVNPKYLAE